METFDIKMKNLKKMEDEMEALDVQINTIIEKERKTKAVRDAYRKKLYDNEKEALSKKTINELTHGMPPSRKKLNTIKQSKEYKEGLAMRLEKSPKIKQLLDENYIFEEDDDYLAFVASHSGKFQEVDLYKTLSTQEKSLSSTYEGVLEELYEDIFKALEGLNFDEVFSSDYDEVLKYYRTLVANHYKKEDQIYAGCHEEWEYRHYYLKDRMYMPLDYGNMDEFFETLKDNAENVLYYIFGFEGFDGIRNEIANKFMEVLEDADKVKKIVEEHPSFEVLNVVLQNGKIKDDMMQEVYYVLDDATTTYAYNIINTLKGELTKKNILKWLQKNKHFTGILEYHQKLDETFNSIPDNYAELYPMARRMMRHFTIHIGPTNSGKTWAAMNTLKQSSNGAYLAPLRLLAFEKYEELNMEGYTASLITGEEQLIQEDALFTCSTIEMANLGQKYDCVVVDECQMLADSQRGGAWTNAILGLQCEDIHLCTSPDALDILVKMIELCDDSYDVVNHERKNELVMEEDVIHFPDNIQKGDALIVFSKRDVHGVASELKEAGINCSIIYGALPYDVRQREAQKFCNGETDVVVATDAIGMGLNLPIRRVVFLKTKKFDGVSERELTGNELRQIAGRAGRYGIFEKGLYNFSSLELKDKKRFEREINTPANQIDLARIDCPRTLIMGMDIHISDVLSKWNNIPLQEGFFKQDVDTKISLATELENFTDDKEFIYTFINFGLDTKNEEIMALWRALYKSELEGKEYRYSKDAISIPEDPTIDKLDELENTFKLCDLLYQYYYNFGYTKNMNDIMAAKKQISMAIMQILSKNKLKARVCKHCGLKLTWDYPYNMCAKCHSMRYPRYGSRYNYYNYYN